MKICQLKAELFRADGRTDRETDLTKLKWLFSILRTRLKIDAALVIATATILTTIFNSLVIEKKTSNSLILNCIVMVALPLIAAGTVGNILTKSKGHSLYFRAFTIRSILGETKLKICTKFHHFEHIPVHNQRFNKIENWARKLSSLPLRSAENIHCCVTLLSSFPGALSCLQAAFTRRTSRHCLGPSEQ
jgi:hypothetical protein